MVKEIISNTQALWQYSQVKGFIVVFVVVVVMLLIACYIHEQNIKN